MTSSTFHLNQAELFSNITILGVSKKLNITVR